MSQLDATLDWNHPVIMETMRDSSVGAEDMRQEGSADGPPPPAAGVTAAFVSIAHVRFYFFYFLHTSLKFQWVASSLGRKKKKLQPELVLPSWLHQ